MHRARVTALAGLFLAAAPIAQAEVPCDQGAFPGVAYGARTATPEIFIDAAVTADADVGVGHTLLVVDVDNTLLDMDTDLGSDQWYRWQSQLIATCGNQPMEVATSVPDTSTDASGSCKRSARFGAMLDIQYLLFAALPMHALQGMDKTVRGLQSLGFPMIVLTARSPRAMAATRRELLRNGIDMSRTAPLGDLQLPTPDPTRPVQYRDGIAMVSGYNKGERLLELLDALGIDEQVRRIVFLDDREKNVCEMQQAFANTGQGHRIMTLRYDAVRERAVSFLTDPARQQAADARWREIRAQLVPACNAIPNLCASRAP